MLTQTLLAVSACLMTANAHLFIKSPTPIPGTAIKDPLADTGINFPCHGVPLPGSDAQKMAVGSNQQLIFDAGVFEGQKGDTYEGGGNTAVHGGGSCQISITYETDAQKVKQASAWKVLYSIEGGCPTNSPANLDGTYYNGPMGKYNGSLPCSDPHANGFDCINDFEFKIPEGVKNGQATLAWTWFNNVGNAEIYMNCVAVDITGGSDDADMSKFPNIFLANIGPTYGGQTERFPVQNLKFPDPGKYVTTKTAYSSVYTSAGVVRTISSAAAFPLLLPGATATTSAAVAYGAAPDSYAASSATSSPAAAPTSYATAPSPYAAVPTLATTASVVPVVPAPSGTGYADSSSGTNTTSGTCTDGKVSCPSPGAVVCVDKDTFGICDIDLCAVPQKVALGTTCANGIVSKRDVVRRRSSRVHRHIPNHIHHKNSL
ncbi:hypothetical protein E4T44_00935 [Aureobasidium sp. EXF-8845]|nr:hypothetical protein E4T44_00935 [Aureobasidium sp. EXF-8845]KAI4857608.1 hypothetical protein E4T45_00901 [Aureobasidium sp. EXF-8846]